VPADDTAFNAAYAAGRFRRGRTLLVATGVAAIVALLLFFALDPPKYVARWDDQSAWVSEDGRRIFLTVTGRDCDDSVLFVVRQSDKRVRVTAVVTQHRLRPCRETPVLRRYSVDLERPLGDRPLLDGRCSRDDAEETAKDDCPAQPVVPVVAG